MKTRTALLALLTIVCLMLAVAPALAGVVYSNGFSDGNTAAWPINFGFSVSDSIPPGGDSSAMALQFLYWDPVPGDVLTTVDVQFGRDPFTGTVNTHNVVFNNDFGRNQHGYELYLGTVLISPDEGIGNFLTLSNACTTSGCSTTPIFWDEDSGPSTAYENVVGSIPSESFILLSSPEPSSILLLGSGILGIVGILRRKLGR
jgi:hypothetical protein